MKGRSRSPWNILSSGNNTGILSSGNNTGILSSGNNTGILSSGNNTGFQSLYRLGAGLLNRARKALSFGGGWGLLGGIASSLFGSNRGKDNQSESPLQMGEGSGKAGGWGAQQPKSFLGSAKAARREEKLGNKQANRDGKVMRREEKKADHEAEVEQKQVKASELVEALGEETVSEAKIEKLTQDVETVDTPVAEAEAATDDSGTSHEVEAPKPEIPQTSNNAGLLPEWDD